MLSIHGMQAILAKYQDYHVVFTVQISSRSLSRSLRRLQIMLPVQLSREILHFVGFSVVFIKLVKSTKFKHAASSRDCLSTVYPRQRDLNWSRHTVVIMQTLNWTNQCPLFMTVRHIFEISEDDHPSLVNHARDH